MLALVALYYAAAHVGFALEFAGPVAAMVWLPVGVGISFLYVAGLRFWPGVLVGDLLVNNYSRLPFGSALGQTIGNVLEVLLAAWLLRRLVRPGAPLGGVGDLGRILIATAAGTALSATVGSLSLLLGGVISDDALPDVWRTWWLGDFSGAVVVVPLVLAWYRRPPPGWLAGRAVEAALVLAVVVGLSTAALHSNRPLAYLVLPALIWAGLRFAWRGATLAVAVTAGVTLWSVSHFQGPFAAHSTTRMVLETQLFILITALTSLCLAAAVAEREELADRLRASHERFVQTVQAERRRLEHNLHDGAQQHLTALVVRLGLGAERARRNPGETAALLEDAATELALAIDELRDLARGIHPHVLTDFGLARAMDSVVARSTVPIELLGMPPTRLDETAEVTAFYLIAEAITNAERYAHASVIRVRAVVRPSLLSIEVVDDGSGGAVERSGTGLRGLRDRVEGIGGSFHIESTPGEGTRILAAIPAIEATAGPSASGTVNPGS